MIIQCKSCSRKFIAKDSDIPREGRMVQCGYCSVSWHQMPISTKTESPKQTKIDAPPKKADEALSVEKMKASDGKTYKFLGSQWAELLPSGKTGLFAKKKIGKELDKLTGRKKVDPIQKKKKKSRELIINAMDNETALSTKNLDNKKQDKEIDKPKQGLGFFGYIFLIVIIAFSAVGILKTFENDLLNNFPQTEYVFELLNQQLEFFAETVKNMIVIVNDLIGSY